MSTASIDRMRVQVLAPPPGAFVVGVSRLGEARLAGSDAASVWQDLTDKTNSIELTRGGTVDGTTTRVDTGRMSVTLVNPKDPTTDPRYRPNTQIRAVPAGAGTFGTVRAPLQDNFAVSAISFVAEAGNKLWLPLYNQGYYLRFSRILILDIDGDPVAGFTMSDFSSKEQWLASDEAKQWSKTGGSDTAEPVPFSLGWGSDPATGIGCHGSGTAASHYTAIRDMSDLTPGESYTILFSCHNASPLNGAVSWELPTVIGTSQEAAEPLFTGIIEDISTRYSKDGRYDWLTIRAVDRVRDLARTPRYGAVAANNVGADSWSRRVREVCSSAGVPLPSVTPGYPLGATASIAPSAWSRWGSMTATSTLQTGSVTPAALTTGFGTRLAIRDAEMPADTGVQFTPRERGVQTTITGLEPGHFYSVSVHAGVPAAAGVGDLSAEARTYVAEVDGIEGTPAALDTLSAAPTSPGTLKVFFRATDDTARLRVMRVFDGSLTGTAAWRPENFEIGYVRINDLSDATDATLPPMVDVVYESTVLNHLEMACQSAGVDWWANRTGGISFRFPGDEREVKLALSDASRPSYTAANLSFDTGRIVNQLEVTNHGRQADASAPGNWLANDVATTYQAAGSVGAFGPRAGSTDMCLPPQLVANRAAQLLSASTSPSLRASSVTVDALDVPDAAQVDIHDRIQVTHRGRTHTYAVAGINHQISGTKWLTTFELRRANGS